jgi:hypothetical protein
VKPLQQFERFVTAKIGGAPLPAVENAILDAAIEFCDRTYIISEIVGPYTINPGPDPIEIESERGLDVASVRRVWIAGRTQTLSALSAQQVEEIYPEGWYDKSCSSVNELVGWSHIESAGLRLVPYLTVTIPSALTMRVAYKPSRDARELPDLLLSRYPEQIAAGALARLHEQADTEYAKPERVKAYRAEFDAAIMEAVNTQDIGFGRPMLRVAQDDIE